MEIKRKMSVNIGKLHLLSPIMTTSGCSGSSSEIYRLADRKKLFAALGAFVTKGVTLHPRHGNPQPRIVETRCGIINSIGLQNSGAKEFVKKELAELLNYQKPILVNISASTVDEFGALAAYLSSNDVNNCISGIEINVSCPNISEGGAAFGVNPSMVKKVVKIVKQNIPERITIITKLSPNVTDIVLPAQAAIEGGTDALSMINTLRAMAIDIEQRKPFLGNQFGGLSGPAIKPIGVFMVYDCFRRLPQCRSREIPIIGIGGVSNWRDAMEYVLAGASAIGIGTEWFVNPSVFQEIHGGIERYLNKINRDFSSLIGAAHRTSG